MPKSVKNLVKIKKEETNPMRNLKKFLALVLAMVMALSLMVTVNAANPVKDFDDAASITAEFVEAADVLTGMKVFKGDEGGFRPGDKIIRAEVAALIYRLATGDVEDVRAGAYANYGNFSDVAESDWFAGYVGYCANAGYIKGNGDGTFNPYGEVTGYETLAMILRAIGYDKNGEFTGTTWETNVSALATQLGILKNIKTTDYGNTLYLASRRDVVAELLFQADAKVPMVIYTTAFGYQQTGMEGGVVGTSKNPTLGKKIFGLAMNDNGVLLGNQQTGEKRSVMGYAGSTEYTGASGAAKLPYTAYAWAGTDSGTDDSSGNDVTVGNNVKYDLETGIDLIGHNLKLWYDDGTGSVSGTTKKVYAYFDQADTAVVKADGVDLTATGANDLATAIANAGFKLNSGKTAVFNNSFSKFGTNTAAQAGDGVALNGTANVTASPVGLYKIIDNDGDKKVDAIIALNIESSKVTETNTVNRVPTLGVPVSNKGSQDGGAANAQIATKFIATANVKAVNAVNTGVVAQDALVGNSTKALGDYEMGIHITGTTPRTVSDNEATAINNATKANMETAYFLLARIDKTVEGTVVAYNTARGTVTLDNGTVLNRSKYYHTVVNWDDSTNNSSSAPASVIPQGWVQGATNWEEGYANVGYKFYLDHEGNYIGAERSYGTTFLYGTYQDYSQETSSSTFNYYLTGVDMNGEIKTVQLKKYWTSAIATATINSTDALGVPFRNPNIASTNTGFGMGEGVYKGFAINGTTADGETADAGTDRNEYLNNMARLGIKYGDDGDAFDSNITIDKNATVLGAKVTSATASGSATDSNKYFTEATKFILVSGFGTDNVKAEVYDGISKLKGDSSSVILDMAGTVTLKSDWTGAPANTMTYYTESPYTYAQSGDTAMKIDTIILPKEAVTWTGGSGLYYVGDPTPTLINSWGTDAWKYNLYQDGELKEVWLTNMPGGSGTTDKALDKDTFLHLEDTGEKANDGQPIYTAGNYDNAGNFTAGTYLTNTLTADLAPAAAGKTYLTEATYSAITRDAQTATFTGTDAAKLLRVADAMVVNLNAEENCIMRPASGFIWPGITDLTTLNEAGSINPVTGRALKVAAVVDPSNPLVVTTIYVCYDQT